jgi:hypothetical protein
VKAYKNLHFDKLEPSLKREKFKDKGQGFKKKLFSLLEVNRRQGHRR